MELSSAQPMPTLLQASGPPGPWCTQINVWVMVGRRRPLLQPPWPQGHAGAVKVPIRLCAAAWQLIPPLLAPGGAAGLTCSKMEGGSCAIASPPAPDELEPPILCVRTRQCAQASAPMRCTQPLRGVRAPRNKAHLLAGALGPARQHAEQEHADQEHVCHAGQVLEKGLSARGVVRQSFLRAERRQGPPARRRDHGEPQQLLVRAQACVVAVALPRVRAEPGLSG